MRCVGDENLYRNLRVARVMPERCIFRPFCSLSPLYNINFSVSLCSIPNVYVVAVAVVVVCNSLLCFWGEKLSRRMMGRRKEIVCGILFHFFSRFGLVALFALRLINNDNSPT